MSFFSDVLDFERFNLRDLGRKIKDDPERLFLGALGPFGSQLWGEILNEDFEPAVNALGRPDDAVFQRAEESGIDIGPASTMHDIASTIAGFFAGQGLGNVAGLEGGISLPNLGGGGGGGKGATQQPEPPLLSTPRPPLRTGGTMDDQARRRAELLSQALRSQSALNSQLGQRANLSALLRNSNAFLG